MRAGYSKRTLIDKLGIKSGFVLIITNPPPSYFQLLGILPPGVKSKKSLSGEFDFIQSFVANHKKLAVEFPKLKKHLKANGMLWISWPKGTSRMSSDLNENSIRDTGLRNGLVDVKVCAIDENWSGLKFVFRLKDRKNEK